MPDGAIELELEKGLLRIEFSFPRKQIHLIADCSVAASDGESGSSSGGVFGWIRQRFGGGGASSSTKDMAWAASLAGGLSDDIVKAQRSDSSQAFTLRLTDFPTAEELAAWVRLLKRHFGQMDG